MHWNTSTNESIKGAPLWEPHYHRTLLWGCCLHLVSRSETKECRLVSWSLLSPPEGRSNSQLAWSFRMFASLFHSKTMFMVEIWIFFWMYNLAQRYSSYDVGEQHMLKQVVISCKVTSCVFNVESCNPFLEEVILLLSGEDLVCPKRSTFQE